MTPLDAPLSLAWLVEGPAPPEEAVDALLDRFGQRLCDADRDEYRQSLLKASPGIRCLAATRMNSSLATGLDAPAAAELGEALLTLMSSRWNDLRPHLSTQPMPALAVALDGWLRAHYVEGRRDTLIDRWRELGQAFPELARETTYWNAGCFAAEARLRSNDIAAAREFLAAVPADLAAEIKQLPQLQGRLEEFTGGRFELDSHPSVGDKGLDILLRGLRGIEPHVAQLHENLTTNATLRPRMDPAGLAALLDDLRTQIAFAESVAPFLDKYRELTPRTHRWRMAFWRFMNPGHWDTDHLNYDWVENCLQRVAWIQSGAVDAADLAGMAGEVLRDIGRSLGWARRANDWHTLWTLRWSAVVVYDRSGDHARMARALDRLCASLRASRMATKDPESFSVVANFFQGLGDKVVALHARQPNARRLMNVFELRRSRALVAARAEVKVGAVDWREPGLLGSGTHYLGFTVLHDVQQVWATLLTADGQLSAQPLAVDWDRLYSVLVNLDPARWQIDNPLLRRLEPWPVLAPLLAPVEDALRSGRIAPGDHVCVAAEDPINLVPLAALPCNDAPLFRSVSLSRVGSLADALNLSRAPIRRPRRAAVTFVEGQHRDPQWRRAHFGANVEQLTGLMNEVDVHAPDLVTRDVLMGRLAMPDTLLHIHAHGAFEPGKNPQTGSGIVVSDGTTPSRTDGSGPLLTPQDLMNAAPDLRASHITLNACVSGQGLPGKGGDLLGMEMAMRLHDLDSLLATHWHVHSGEGAVFCEAFYARWLGEKMSRAQAWRAAIESLADANAPIPEQARWCAFSLYGAWN